MVVNIRTEMKAQRRTSSDFFGGGDTRRLLPPLLRRTHGPAIDQARGPGQDEQGRAARRRASRQTQRASGTGFIISKDGFILTNNHVVEDATKIEVSLYGDDRQVIYSAKLIGRDPLTDSALIQLIEKPKHPLPEAKFGDSSQMAPGDWVMAIGNPFGYTYTVTVGVISATQARVPRDRRPHRTRCCRPTPRSTRATPADRC